MNLFSTAQTWRTSISKTALLTCDGSVNAQCLSTIAKSADQLDRAALVSAAVLICCGAAEANADKIEFDIAGVTQGGRDFGNWTIVASKTGHDAARAKGKE